MTVYMNTIPSPEQSLSGLVPPANPPARPIHISTLVAFFALAFAWTWLFWGSLAFLRIPFPRDLSGGPGAWLILLGAIGPLAAALALSARSAGSKGVRTLLSSAFHWRFGSAWYFAVLLGPGALLFLAVMASAALGTQPGGALFNALTGAWLLIGIGQLWAAVGEEYGWRGYALPRIQDRFGSLIAALVVGLFWALWYLPLFFVPHSYQSSLPFSLFLISRVLDSILYTLVYNRTGRRLWSVMLLHGAQNLWGQVLPLAPGGLWIYTLLQAGLVVVALRYLPRPWFHSRTMPAATASVAPRSTLGWLRKIRRTRSPRSKP